MENGTLDVVAPDSSNGTLPSGDAGFFEAVPLGPEGRLDTSDPCSHEVI